ncbi:MAG: hypothetical protein KGI07_05650 [Thaumarchaeota archaeon]|nr:hypothetical protein [Nitrososphaerota archaeon]
MKSWLKLLVAGIIPALVGMYLTQVYGLTTEIGVISMMVGAIGLAMVMLGVIIGLKRAFRHMLNE